jgi:toxin ParE1/3/4
VARVVWTEQALDDLDAVCLFMARDAPRYAQALAARVFRATERLAEFPRSDRVVPEFERDDVREVSVQSYRVIYRHRPDEVQILTAHHGARLLGPSGYL